jgi:hemerythrin-like metal-binding protein
MAFIEWSDELRIGVDSVDSQHQHLVGLINGLYQAMKQGQATRELLRILTELTDYAKYHFENEEAFMRSHGYAGYEAHKEEHDAFRERVRELRENFRAGRSVPSIDLINFLKDWLLHHVQERDKKLQELIPESSGGQDEFFAEER